MGYLAVVVDKYGCALKIYIRVYGDSLGEISVNVIGCALGSLYGLTAFVSVLMGFKKSLEIINLLTGEIKTLKDINIASADIFSISPDGTKAVFASYGEMNENGTPIQTVIYCTTDNSASPVIFSEPMLFDESAGFVWVDGGFMSARALDSTGAKVGSVVYAF